MQIPQVFGGGDESQMGHDGRRQKGEERKSTSSQCQDSVRRENVVKCIFNVYLDDVLTNTYVAALNEKGKNIPSQDDMSTELCTSLLFRQHLYTGVNIYNANHT